MEKQWYSKNPKSSEFGTLDRDKLDEVKNIPSREDALTLHSQTQKNIGSSAAARISDLQEGISIKSVTQKNKGGKND